MTAPTNIQMINGPDGKPAYVVMAYADYVTAFGQDKDYVPHEIVQAVIDGTSIVRAWREYLHMTQAEMALRMGISQPSYAKQEGSENLRPATLKKIAAALGITLEQLDL